MSIEDDLFQASHDDDELPSSGMMFSENLLALRELEPARVLVDHASPLAAGPNKMQWTDTPAATILVQGPTGAGKRRMVLAVMRALRLRIVEVPAVLFESASDVARLMRRKERGRGVFLLTRLDDVLGSPQAERRVATFMRAAAAPEAGALWSPCLEPWLCVGTTQLEGVEDLVGDETDRRLAVSRSSHADRVRFGLGRDLAAAFQRVVRLAAPEVDELERLLDVECSRPMEEIVPLQDVRGRIQRYGIDEVEIDRSGRQRLLDLTVHFGAGFHGVQAAVAQLAEKLNRIELMAAYKHGKTSLVISADIMGFKTTFDVPQGY
jgi:hypothetical protein